VCVNLTAVTNRSADDIDSESRWWYGSWYANIGLCVSVCASVHSLTQLLVEVNQLSRVGHPTTSSDSHPLPSDVLPTTCICHVLFVCWNCVVLHLDDVKICSNSKLLSDTLWTFFTPASACYVGFTLFSELNVFWWCHAHCHFILYLFMLKFTCKSIFHYCTCVTALALTVSDRCIMLFAALNQVLFLCLHLIFLFHGMVVW